MKKYFVLLLTIIMMGVLVTAASAGALGVNVPPGYVVEVDSLFASGSSDFCPSFIAGLNDHWAIGVMYDTTGKYFTATGRYLIVKNLATDVFYRFYNTGSWIVDLRGKFFVNQNLALAG